MQRCAGIIFPSITKFPYVEVIMQEKMIEVDGKQIKECFESHYCNALRQVSPIRHSPNAETDNLGETAEGDL